MQKGGRITRTPTGPRRHGNRQRNASRCRSVWEGRGLCPRGDGGRGGDAIA